MRICSEEGCEKPHIAKGLCRKHYKRMSLSIAPNRVRKLSLEEMFWARVEKTESCWIWTGVRNNYGYGELKRSKSERYLAHRLSFFIHNGYWPEPLCLHSCDTPPCVNPAHLRAGTSKENTADAMERKRHSLLGSKGEENWNAKLTDEIVREARRRHIPWKVSIPQLAREYGVCPDTLGRAIRGQRWKHVK